MTKLEAIPRASAECAYDDDDSRKVILIRRSEAEGHRTIAIGRAIVTSATSSEALAAAEPAGAPMRTYRPSVARAWRVRERAGRGGRHPRLLAAVLRWRRPFGVRR